jgi:hypothetical protein
MRRSMSLLLATTAGVILLVNGGALAPATAQEGQGPPREALQNLYPERPYSPYAGDAVPTQVYWGDTHLHTSASMDAGSFGARLSPEDAYRFARGEEVASSTGQRARLARPLDFLVVSDHSDGMGFFPDLLDGDPAILAYPLGRRWYEMIQSGSGVDAALELIDNFSRGDAATLGMLEALYSPAAPGYRNQWDRTIAAAEAFNEPGRFTAFIGYEWTSLAPPGNNLHRVVIYRDGTTRASQSVPFTTQPPLGSIHPEDLWDYLQAYEDKTGGQVLAIAHNGNLSNGTMFPYETNPRDNSPLTPKYAETRDRWEPLYEVTQIKGDGEAHPFLSPNDEFADYETWDIGNLNVSEAKTDDMLEREYARSALQLGLKLEEELGVNPYKFGMIGSTDSHTGLATADDDNFFGKHAGGEPSAERMSHVFMQADAGTIMGWQEVASGYAAVWARDNTRAAIFDAMRRKETYATTGPRMVVRFFGGWDFDTDDVMNRRPAEIGYMRGVPMGADLTPNPGTGAPRFLVAALKDPIGANLDRIQIVKGWLGTDGTMQERIYDVAVSDGREIDANGRCTVPVGNTVDVETATWANTIGDPELISVWEDPDFDPDVRAFYYVRVLQIPTPRWPAYDARYYGTTLPDDVDFVAQERGYTSPIWYTPQK